MVETLNSGMFKNRFQLVQDFATIHRMFILNNWDDFTSENGVKYPTFDCGFEPPISDGKTSTYPLIFGNLTYLWKMDEHGKWK